MVDEGPELSFVNKKTGNPDHLVVYGTGAIVRSSDGMVLGRGNREAAQRIVEKLRRPE